MAVRNSLGQFARKSLQDLTPAYRRRIENAEARGLSRKAARGHAPKALPAYQTAAEATNPRYRKARDAVALMRADGVSLTRASKALGISPDTVRRYAGSAIERDSKGRYQAKAVDRLYRQMRMLTLRGQVLVEPASSKEAEKIGQYWAAVDHYLKTGDDRYLRKFTYKQLRLRDKTKMYFVTDLQELERLANAGELSFEDLYPR